MLFLHVRPQKRWYGQQDLGRASCLRDFTVVPEAVLEDCLGHLRLPPLRRQQLPQGRTERLACNGFLSWLQGLRRGACLSCHCHGAISTTLQVWQPFLSWKQCHIGVEHVKKEHGEVYEEGLIVPNTLLLDLTWGRKGCCTGI